jgi:predicted glycoside hydrolase/deacetylase ChbG (UPF0249 family)
LTTCGFPAVAGSERIRSLIVNADDFGLTAGINQGVIRAHEHGIVTSASLMVRGPAARFAADYARQRPVLSVGLHIDLGEWVYRDGEWRPAYQVVPPEDATAIAAEIRRQLDHFVKLTGRLPTHLDSHQHVHREEPARSIVLALGQELGVPVRHLDPKISYCGAFYGQTGDGSPIPDALSFDHLASILAALPPGTTELLCHPGLQADVDSVYRDEREREAETLCDPRLPSLLGTLSIRLRSFHLLNEEEEATVR